MWYIPSSPISTQSVCLCIHYNIEFSTCTEKGLTEKSIEATLYIVDIVVW